MPENTFPGDFAQSFSIIHRAFQRDVLPQYKEMGLNATSAYILLLLHQQGDSSQNELARTLVINKGQIAREVRWLHTDGYVSQTQSTDNRTTNIIHITDDGQAIIPQIISIRNRWWQERLDNNQIDPDNSFKDTLDVLMTELKKQHQQS